MTTPQAAGHLPPSPSIYRSADGRAAIDAWYERKLAQFPLPTQSQVFASTAGPTHVISAGPVDGAPVVVLHGMNLNGPSMAPSIVALAQTYRVYAVDIIGMPGRSAEVRLPRAGDSYARWLLSVLDGLGLKHAAFLGHSFGGWLILKLAALDPERIRSAVLLDSGGLTPFTIRGQTISGLAAVRYRLFPNERNRQRATVRLFYAPGSTPDPDLVDLFALGFRHVTFDVDPRGLPPVPASALTRLRAPILVLYGAHDIFFDVARATARAHIILPNLVAAECMAEQGHVPGMEAYESVHGRIASFFVQAGAAPAKRR